jgi:hypothetical protein
LGGDAYLSKAPIFNVKLKPMPTDSQKDDQHWQWTFWYVAGSTGLILAYIVVITFVRVPADNVRFVDTSLGFLLGTFLAGGAGYLLGGSALISPSSIKPTDKNEPSGPAITTTTTIPIPDPTPTVTPTEGT